MKKPENAPKHGLNLRFLGAAGEVTPSGTLVDYIAGNVRILIDAGGAIQREETEDGKHMRSIEAPKNVDTIMFTHIHTDHIALAALVALLNPDANIFVPEGSKRAALIMMIEAFKRQKGRNTSGELEENNKLLGGLISHMEKLEGEIKKGVPRGQGGSRIEETISHEQKNGQNKSLEKQLEDTEAEIYDLLGLKKDSIKELLELIGKNPDHSANYDVQTKDFKAAKKIRFNEQRERIQEEGKVSDRDVTLAHNRMIELKLGVSHNVAAVQKKHLGNRNIKAILRNSGHLHSVPATQILLKIPIKGGSYFTIVFSGDKGNSQFKPPYAQADDVGLKNSANVLVLESTYGGRTHSNREKALEKLDEVIIAAVEKGEDIIFPIISLDRPLVVMYEIVMRLIRTEKIKPEQVDITYFGRMIEDLLPIAKQQEMYKEIKKYYPHWKPLSHDQLWSLVENTGTSRIVFAGGGFLPKSGSPAGAVLEKALNQKELTIIFTSYHGDEGSNASNLIAGEDFFLSDKGTKPHKLKKGHKPYYNTGFSGHEDGPGLVQYAREVIKAGGTIFLNHGTEESREGLAGLLLRDDIIREKGVKIVLPKRDKDYGLKKPHRHK